MIFDLDSTDFGKSGYVLCVPKSRFGRAIVFGSLTLFSFTVIEQYSNISQKFCLRFRRFWPKSGFVLSGPKSKFGAVFHLGLWVKCDVVIEDLNFEFEKGAI